MVPLLLGFFFSPKMYYIKTAEWTDWNETDTANVKTAMGEENTEERFHLYFQYYNVLHELRLGLITYNKGVDLHVVDEQESTVIINEAVENFNEWGAVFPEGSPILQQ